MSGESEINVEGSRFWVLASSEHNINEIFLLFEMVSIVDKSVINDLSDEADWRLSSVFIKEWHVKIIHEVDESLAWWWTEGSTSSLVYLRFNNDLKSFGVSVVIEIDG